MYYLETGYGKHNRLRNAVLLALAAHAALVLAVSFDSGKERYKAPQIDVTLATQPSQDAPDDARHMAQTNQVGSGEQADVSAVTSRNSQLPSMNQAQQQNLPPSGMNRQHRGTRRLPPPPAACRQPSANSVSQMRRQVPTQGYQPRG